jgi:hypothetical protein
MTAYRLRWLLLVLGESCLLGFVWWIAGPLLFGENFETAAPIIWWLPTSLLNFVLPEEASDSMIYGFHLAIFFACMLLTQWFFLRPRREWRVGLGETARPMKTAIVAAAFMAMMLTVGATLTVLELIELSEAIDNEWVVPLAATVVWVVWALLFYAYWKKGTRLDQLRTMAHRLIVGSVLELFVATGVFVSKPDSENCWCARGSYAGLVFGATVMIWAFGPGLIFLFLREARYRRAEPR